MDRLVVVVSLKKGTTSRVRELLKEGPPFELEGTVFDRHDVLLTDREAVFVFEGQGTSSTLQLPGEDPGLWRAAEAWAECIAGRPRVARTAFSWQRVDGSEVSRSIPPRPRP